MIKRDFHGWLLSDAVKEVHSIVGQVRKDRRPDAAEFITGNGVIKVAVLEILESYKLAPIVRWGNAGTIDVFIE